MQHFENLRSILQDRAPTFYDLKAWRHKMGGIKQGEAGELLGISKRTYHKYEKQDNFPKYIRYACERHLIIISTHTLLKNYGDIK